MSENLVLSEDNAVELLAFLATSARGVLDEPELYGSFRLIDAASRLLGFILDSGKASDEAGLRKLKEQIDDHKLLMMTDEAAFRAFLDDMVREVTLELKRRSA